MGQWIGICTMLVSHPDCVYSISDWQISEYLETNFFNVKVESTIEA